MRFITNLISKLSLSGKTIIGVALIELIAFSYLITMESSIVYDSNRALYERSAKDISELFTSSITNAVISFDIAEIESAIDQFTDRDSVLGVNVVDFNDRILASQHKTNEIDLINKFEIQVPITVGADYFGRADFIYDISIVEENSDLAKVMGFQIAIVGLLLVAIFSYVLGKYLTYRIRNLSKSVNAIANGDLSSKVEWTGEDEISNFSQLLESMRKELLHANSVMQANQDNLTKKSYELKQALKLSDQAKKREADMFAILGHEIRTPISILKMELESGDVIDINRMKSNVDHTLSLIDDMSLVARIGSVRNFDIRSVDLHELFKELLDGIRHQAESKDINLIGELDFEKCQVKVSEKALRQILLNLLKNSIIHSGCKTLTLSATLERQSNQSVSLHVSVSDDGKGIKPELQNAVFESFTRGDNVKEGTGIGLSICRELVEHFGGELSLRSDGEHGCSFSFSLMLDIDKSVAQDYADKSTASEKLVSPIKGLSVLVVEDSYVIQVFTKKMLELKGAKVICVNNGNEGIQKLKQHAFDLIISDLMMPIMDGVEMTKRLRGMGVSIAIIGVTAATIGNETEQFLNAGADMVLSKPINLKNVESFISSRLLKEKES